MSTDRGDAVHDALDRYLAPILERAAKAPRGAMAGHAGALELALREGFRHALPPEKFSEIAGLLREGLAAAEDRDYLLSVVATLQRECLWVESALYRYFVAPPVYH